jgi:hypothetical protein
VPQIVHSTDGASLADVLERVLDRGVVIAGDIRIRLVEVELLTISIRLLIASVDKAREIGIDWWTQSSFLSSEAPRGIADARPDLETDLRDVQSRLARLEIQQR